ncbi:MAG TPA: bifunctional (p)ppGpp synthetase/guanosine-3',5'-bis(diphosphate) 3'-pyrophosphohydrolase [Blastocatellia bacterium]|nr:bifunctional (p)ppGpp synthetase/guanosine-3',5'-bis(diphosphate) 3'-pyrophosphohydrolase [Blastocatellia bacterium]
MIRFEDILEKVERYHPEADLELLRRAYIFSAREHRGQVRMSGEPYLVHPLEVAGLLADMKLDVVTVSAGLLHDTVEDSLTTIEQIEQYFGPEIARIVNGVTKISQITVASREEAQAESLRKMVLAMVDDVRVILVKLADRLHNMRTLGYLPRDKQVRIARETLEVYAPIAHRLGMGRIRGELEDLAFQYLLPEDYHRLKEAVDKKRPALEATLEVMKKEIRARLDAERIPVIAVEGRVKRLYSIFQKMRRKKVTLDEIYDLVAVRIITTSVRDCYAALGVIHQAWPPIPGRFRDWIATPRENMYQSLHTSVLGQDGVPLEIQIRTEQMHRIAEEGIAAHWKYKEGKLGEHVEDRAFAWLRRLLDEQQETRDAREFLENLKLDLYPTEVFAFTPKGKVIELPRGATPVDFAYAIHTEVGHTCTGAKVNGRIVPLRYQIRNGDVVEIITTAGHHPSRDWLSFVKTNRARTKIRKWLSEAERREAIELGKRLLEREAEKFHLSLKKLTSNGELEKIAPDYGYQKLDDLYAAVGYGKVSPRGVIIRFVPPEVIAEVEEKPPTKIAEVTERVKKALGLRDAAIRVKGMDDLMVYRARCCNPIRGEEIIGYITRGKGVAVHARRCTNVPGLMVNRERIIPVEWMKGGDQEPYAVPLHVTVEDRPGVLAEITSAIASIKTNIRDARARTTPDGRGEIRITVEIFDLKHLQRIIAAIKAVEGVIDVERAER